MLIPAWLAILAAALLGATVGSFLNVCIWRLPREGMTVASPKRSHCTSCGFMIPWHDNIPLLSWIWLGGHCRSCRVPISGRYLLVEGLTAMAFSILTERFLLGPEPSPAVLATLLVITSAAIVVGFIDQDLQIIPDEITLPGMMAVPALALLVPGLHLPPAPLISEALASVRGPLEGVSGRLPALLREPLPAAGLVSLAAGLSAGLGLLGYRLFWRLAHGGRRKPLRDCLLAMVLAGSAGGALGAMALRPEWILHPRILGLWSALAGMAAGSGLVLGVGVLGSQVFRKEAMGFGDVKLMGFLGGFAGWTGVVAGFALACLLGSVVGIYRLLRYRSRYLPFGPYLALGSLAMILWPGAFREALDWYLGLFR